MNLEYAKRHLFVVVLMTAMGCWFGYDGFVRYPSMSAGELYSSAHNGAESQSVEEADKFAVTAIKRQKEFLVICFVIAAVVGLRLFNSYRFDFTWDESGFTSAGKRYAFSDIREIDRRDWEKKGIVRLELDGRAIVLDSWHHVGVKEFVKAKLEVGG